jgi:hypothetical protein
MLLFLVYVIVNTKLNAALKVNKFVIECICDKILHLYATSLRCLISYLLLYTLLLIIFVQL